jgi:hypothetical protein
MMAGVVLVAATACVDTGLERFGLIDDDGRPVGGLGATLTGIESVRFTTESLPQLRAAIAETLRCDHALDYSADEIIVTAGVQESIMLLMLGLVNPGDEVLITSPRFTTYDMAVHMCGGVPVPAGGSVLMLATRP